MLDSVALFMRAWIEILVIIPCQPMYIVALFTRAWIEIYFLILKIKDY